jgi:hypothetical protein
MAPRKPKKNIGDQVGGWLGGAAKGVQSWSESQARTFTNPYINVAGRALGKNPNLPTSGVREAVSNTAFAAADIASGPIARSAGKAVTAVGRTVANTGVPARVVNKVTGQTVLVHGSPTQGIKTIYPRQGANRKQWTGGADLGLQGFYGVPSKNPQFGPSQISTKFALGDQEKNIAQNVVGQGSVYLAKTKKVDLIFEQGGTVARTKQPGRVLKEIKLSDYPRENTASLIDDYVAALKRAGGPTVPRNIRKQLRGGGKNKK